MWMRSPKSHPTRAIAFRNDAVEIVDAVRLILDGHTALAFLLGEALWYGVLCPCPRDRAIDGCAVYSHGDQAAVCGKPGAALGRGRRCCRYPAKARLDGAGHGRQQDRCCNEIALIDEGLEQSAPPRRFRGFIRFSSGCPAGCGLKTIPSSQCVKTDMALRTFLAFSNGLGGPSPDGRSRAQTCDFLFFAAFTA
jgi:hypothetical protein